MPNVAIYDITGKTVGEMELNETIFGAEIKKHIVHTALVNYLANQRQGTQSALTRAEVRGGGAKPWRQKGTGRARQGSIRSPQWTHGGVVFAPKPRDYRKTLNKKVKRAALFSVLSDKVANGDFIVLNSLELAEIKTKKMAEVLGNLQASKKSLIVTASQDEKVIKSARNIPGVKTANASTLNIYDLLTTDKCVIVSDAVKQIEEVYSR